MRDPIMSVTWEMTYQKRVEETHSWMSLLTNPISLRTAHHREGPPIQASLCYPITWEIEPDRKLNKAYFHSTYLLFPDTPLPL